MDAHTRISHYEILSAIGKGGMGEVWKARDTNLEGQPGDAKSCFDPDLLARARNVEFWSFWVSECYAFIDETDLAMDWLETAFRKGYWNYPYISKHSTIFRKLDGHPRFEGLLARIKTAWEQFEP